MIRKFIYTRIVLESFNFLRVAIKRRKLSYVAIVLFIFFASKQQAQIVINNAGIININGGTLASPSYIVLNNPPATPIKTIGTTGGIMMESEYNITKYNIGAGTTSITVPYFSTTSGSNQFPLAVTGISGGVGAGNIQFSSKKAPTLSTGYDNVLYMPSDVNNMNGYNPPPTFVADNSLNAIDRFWIIDAKGYTTSPAATYAFGYLTTEAATNGGNIAGLAANLEAMAFDKGAFTWGNYGPTGVNTTGVPTGTVSGASISAGLMGNVFRSWTLVNKLNPLPVELLSYTGACLNNGINLNWSTAAESNSSYFTIEKSFDGLNFTWVTNINAAGNSNQQKKYSYLDNSAITTYYRLSETDKNGLQKMYGAIVINACTENIKESINAFSTNENIYLNVNAAANQPVNITLYDVTGRLIYKDVLVATQGNNNFTVKPEVAKGIYLVEVTTGTSYFVKKMPLIDK